MHHHTWTENSGTTERCEACGAIRYALDGNGNPVPVARARRFRYAVNLSARSSRVEPPCKGARDAAHA